MRTVRLQSLTSNAELMVNPYHIQRLEQLAGDAGVRVYLNETVGAVTLDVSDPIHRILGLIESAVQR
jgi:hypothetical protein